MVETPIAEGEGGGSGTVPCPKPTEPRTDEQVHLDGTRLGLVDDAVRVWDGVACEREDKERVLFRDVEHAVVRVDGDGGAEEPFLLMVRGPEGRDRGLGEVMGFREVEDVGEGLNGDEKGQQGVGRSCCRGSLIWLG